MPEGDTIYRTATTLRKALLGRTVTRFESEVETVRAVDRMAAVAGRQIEGVEPRGKHLLIAFGTQGRAEGGGRISRVGSSLIGVADSDSDSPATDQRTTPYAGPVVLHTHLRMTGSWHIYRPGEAWRKPARQAKVVIHTDAFVAPCFNAPVVELLTAAQAARHPELAALGPDAITEAFDPAEALRRLRRRPEAEIAVALLDQRALAGVGNVYKSEVLFLRGVSPFRKVRDLDNATLAGLVDECHRLLRLNRGGGSRRTLYSLNDRERLWVYARGGEPCRKCGTLVRMRRQGIDARSTYFCPKCQGAD